VVKLIGERNNTELCDTCKAPMQRDKVAEMSGSHTQKQLLEYYDVGLGTWIKDRSSWIKHLDKNNLTPYTKNEHLWDGN